MQPSTTVKQNVFEDVSRNETISKFIDDVSDVSFVS